MFSRWIVTNITSARGTLHCRKTSIPCGDQLVILDCIYIHVVQDKVQWWAVTNVVMKT
jgi:hypothetical protein